MALQATRRVRWSPGHLSSLRVISIAMPHALAWRASGSVSPTTMTRSCKRPASAASVFRTTSGPIPAGSPIANATLGPRIALFTSERDCEQRVELMAVGHYDPLDELAGRARNVDTVAVDA